MNHKFILRKRSNEKRPPSWSFVELAAKLDIKQQKLALMMKRPDAPKPTMEMRNAKYYEPVAFINWYRSITK